MLYTCISFAKKSCDARYAWNPLNRTSRCGINTAHFAIAPLKFGAQTSQLGTSALLITQTSPKPPAASLSPTEKSPHPLPAWLREAADPQLRFRPPASNPDVSKAQHHPVAYSNKDLDQLILRLSQNPATCSRLSTVHNWLKSIDHGFDSRLCTTLISAYVHARQPAAALKIFFWMVAESENGREEIIPTVYTYTAAIQAATAARAFSQAATIWKHAQSARVRADAQLSCTYMAALFQAGCYSQVLQIFDRMRDRQQQTPAQAYVAAIRSLTKMGESQAALQLWDEMQLDHKAGVAGHAYSAAISACAHAKNPQRAHDIFQQMIRCGVRPDCVSCTSLMHAYASTGAWKDAEGLLKRMQNSGMQPQSHTYAALMASYGTADELGRAVALWRAMRTPNWQGPSAGAHVLAVLLKAVGRGGASRGASVELAEALFAEAMADAPQASRWAAGLPRASVSGPPEAVLAKTWGRRTEEGFFAVEALFSHGNDVRESRTHEAEDASQELDGWGWRARSDNALAGGLSCTAGAAWVWSDSQTASNHTVPPGMSTSVAGMQQEQPGVTVQCAGLSAAGASASVAAAEKEPMLDPESAEALVSVFTREGTSRMHTYKGGWAINDVVCLALMTTYLRAGRWRECAAVIGRARELGVAPTSRMVNTAMYAAACAKQPHVAEALFDSIAGEQWRVSWETLVFAYSQCGMHAEAEAVVAHMQANNTPLRDYVAVALIQAYSEAGQWRVALRIEQRLKQMGVRPTVHVLNALLTVCVRHHVYDRGVKLLAEFKVREGPGRTRVTELLARAVCQEEVSAIETQQVLTTALSGVAAAVGGALIRSGLF